VPAPAEAIEAAFAALEVGNRFQFTRTFTEAEVSLFIGVTGDFNPYHTDAEFMASTRFKRPIVPGLLTGSMLTHVGGLLGFLAHEMAFQFLAPVYPGDTITMEMWVAEKDPARRHMVLEAECRNSHGDLVLRGRVVGFPTRVRLRPEQDVLKTGNTS